MMNLVGETSNLRGHVGYSEVSQPLDDVLQKMLGAIPRQMRRLGCMMKPSGKEKRNVARERIQKKFSFSWYTADSLNSVVDHGAAGSDKKRIGALQRCGR